MATPAEKIEFARTIEGLFQKGLDGRITPELKAALKSEGLDLDKPLLPGYPAADFHKWVSTAARYLHPELPPAEGVRLMGRASVPGLEDTMIGRALVSGLKLIGPRRTLERVQRIFGNNGNYQKVTLESAEATGGRLVVGEVFGIPTFYLGVFEQVLPLIGAKDPKVVLAASPPPGAVFVVSWS